MVAVTNTRVVNDLESVSRLKRLQYKEQLVRPMLLLLVAFVRVIIKHTAKDICNICV